MWVKLRKEELEPPDRQSKAGSKKPKLDRPTAERKKASHAGPLEKGNNPISEKPKINKKSPERAKLRINGRKPKVAFPITENVLTDSTPASPNRGMVEPRQTRPRIKSDEAKCAKSHINGPKPERARLFKNIKNPKCKKSKTERERLMRLTPKTKTGRSACTKL